MFIALAIKSEKIILQRDAPSSNLTGVIAAYHALEQTVTKQQSRIRELQTEYDKLLEDKGRDKGQIASQLYDAQFLAGLTKVEGPGVVVTLRDSEKRAPNNLPSGLTTDLTNMYIIHDVDIQRVLNELRAGGAESLAINDQRVVAITSVRCVGPAIQVNGVPQTPPFRISAIGDEKSLAATLALPGGIGEMLRSTDPEMITIEQKPKLILPAYAGFESRYAKPL
jgi:uncharacterized protein YlxW (UPF0749 family)